MDRALKYNERELLRRLSAGDSMAFEQLFREWHQELGAYIFNIIKDMQQTEDVVQEAFIKVWNHRGEAAGIDNFRSWLFTVARNHTFNLLRDRARKGSLEKSWIEYQQLMGLPTGEADLYAGIEKAVSLLSPQRQKVYLMSRRDGLRQKEIATRLGISVETVKKHIMAATREVADQLRNTRGIPILPLLITLSALCLA